MAGTITENEYNAALKRKFQAKSPWLESLLGTKEEVTREKRRIDGYKAKIQQSHNQIDFQEKLRDQLILEAVQAGDTITSVAWAAGVSRSTVHNMIKRLDTE